MSRFSMIHRVSIIFRLPSLLHCSPTKRVVLLAIVFLRQAASFTPQIFTHHTSRRTPIMDELATEERDNSAQFHMLNYNESDFIVDPLLKYLATDPAGNRSNQHFNVEEAINALTTDGYYHIPGVLTAEECNHALGQMWDFVEDISAGCVNRNDPKSWYPKGELKDADEILNSESNVGGRNEKPSESEEDIDPWPHTGYSSFPDMFQSLGAGFVLGNMRELLAERIFEPLFGTRELISSKEGFTFCRPLVVHADEKRLVWNRYQSTSSQINPGQIRPVFKVCGKSQPLSEGQHYDQGVPRSVMDHILNIGVDVDTTNVHKHKKFNKKQKIKDLTGLCHIQASVSFIDQSAGKICGGGHFLCYPCSHSEVHWRLVGGTYRATPTPSNEEKDRSWVPLADKEIQQLGDVGCQEKRIFANAGDVILWRSDLVHAGVAPSLTLLKDSNSDDKLFYDGPNEFRAVGYCSMLPLSAIKDYAYFSLPRQKMKNGSNDSAKSMKRALQKELDRIKLEAYRTGRTGDHRPELESWHDHRRTTMWNSLPPTKVKPHGNPPRVLQRPRYRLGPAELTTRQAELYGVLPYPNHEEDCTKKLKAMIRGVRFVSEQSGEVEYSNASVETAVCSAALEFLTAEDANGKTPSLVGQDKYLGGMASPCTRYVFGVPGHAKRVIRVTTDTGKVDWIGPEFVGEFKWLRGVEIPGCDEWPAGCCLALPCNSEAGCVLKINPESSEVSTFVTGDPIPFGAGWLYHGGNLAYDGYVYAIPASAPKVMKIHPWKETTEVIGPNFEGKAKWYGGIAGSDGCIYGIPHNANGVLKIDPSTQEVTILAEGTLPDGQWKWHGGLASLDGNKIIGFPNNSDSILVVNVLEQKVYLVGDNAILKSGTHRVPQDGRYKYLGGSLSADGRYCYLFPCDAEYVLRMDMSTDELKLVGPRMTEGENKFQNGFVSRDGCVYGIPQRSSGVLRIIPPGVRRWDNNGNELPCDQEVVDVMYCGDDMVSCKDKFEGGVLGADESVYCIPLRAKTFVKVVPGPSIERV